MPLVSVIMPAYNVEPYVGDAIRSALARAFASDIDNVRSTIERP